jgi:alpha 1,6-mannosyltransferase
VATTPSPQAPIAIPQKLWYKLGPNGLNDELRRYTDSCITKNPTFETKFVTDGSGDEFVKQYLTSRPDIADNFLAISIPIVKADLFRYLILYEHGGIWNDLDVSCEAPISDWVPEQYKANASIVVGLEFDVDIWVRQFASWTIMARPKSPHLMTVVEDCIEGLLNKAKEHNVGIQDLKLDMIDDIVDVSGPRRLTRGIQKSLSKMLGKEVGNDDISHVLEPRLIGDVLVLPDYAFANSMNQQHGDKKQGQVLVTHHYAGSWKNAKGGEEPITRIE